MEKPTNYLRLDPITKEAEVFIMIYVWLNWIMIWIKGALKADQSDA